MTTVNEPDLAFQAVVEAIDLAPADGGEGDLALADVVSALARGLGQAQLALDADAAGGVVAADTDSLEAGVLPPCYQITESTVDLQLVLRFPDAHPDTGVGSADAHGAGIGSADARGTGSGELRNVRVSYPGVATPPGMVSTVRVVLRPVAPAGLVVPPVHPSTLPPTRVMAD